MKLFTRQETAEILGIGLSTLDMLKRERRIGYLQEGPGHKLRFSETHIEKYLKRIEQDARTTGFEKKNR